ncbi:MAG: HD domain-containing protein [Flavobacteriales bacterium]
MGNGKIFNDPVHGFISVENPVDFKVIEHSYFQRLRRISQLGLTYLVYPGAHHTRFHHALGAYHLMKKAIRTLKEKGIEISLEEENGACRAILLHDIGHGPFSHALEHSIVPHISHEAISLKLMEFFNKEFPGEFDLAIKMFKKQYHRSFFNDLISSQLDVDRLDYLKRDSFFTGVSEGVVNADRLISMMNVVDNELVIEQKAIYSVEKFILSRRLMYWQVYLHKTVLSAEIVLEKILKRAKYLVLNGKTLFSTKNMHYFLSNTVLIEDFNREEVLAKFCALDEYDIMSSIKEWVDSDDFILSNLCGRIVNRDLLKLKFNDSHPENWDDYIIKKRKEVKEMYQLPNEDIDYFVFENEISQSIYNPDSDIIRIYLKNGEVEPFGAKTEHINFGLLTGINSKKFICYPNSI